MNFHGSSELPHPEDSEEWKSPSFSGDFYREVDHVCRGVSISASDVLGPTYKDFGGSLGGDFYRDPDDVVKGLSLGGGGFTSSFEKLDCSSTLKQKNDFSTECFQQDDLPLPLPSDPFFKLEVTTMTAYSHSPFEIGNSLLDFFNQQVVSTLTKVRRHKYAIKADVFADSMMCTLKVRVYSQWGTGQFAIEFQRRSGDSISFNATFQKASQYLASQQQHFNLEESQVPSFNFQPLQLPAGLEEQTVDEEQLQPLLDMTSQSHMPRLQAEAATALSKLAAEGEPAVRTTRVFDGISDLLQSSSTEVDHPTAVLISHLATQSEAAPLFASDIFLKILNKVRSPETNAQVRLMFAKALYSASLGQSGATLSQHAATGIIRELSFQKELTFGNAFDNEVAQRLELAQNHFSRTFGASL